MFRLFFLIFFSSKFVCASIDLLDAVVDIQVVTAHYDYGSPWQSSSQYQLRGSGFLIEGNYILTNAHVVQGYLSIEVKAQNGRVSYAEVVAISHAGDLALLQLETPSILSGVEPLRIRDHMVEMNEKITIVGFPMIGETLCVTEGRVIQTEVSYYVHTFSELLVHRVDGRAFEGNSGGPVLAGEEVVGILHQGSQEVQDIIPVPIIQHFLEEVRGGRVEGFPMFSCQFLSFYQSVRNPALRAYYGLNSSEDGILVRYIPENHFLYEEIFPGDIILSIDGYKIAQDQMVKLKSGLKVNFRYLIAQKFYGEDLELVVLRDGVRLSLKVYIDPSKKGEPLILRDRLDRPPTYYMHGGLVFQPIDSQFKIDFDSFDYSDRLDYYFYSGKVEGGRSEVIVITKILPDPVNEGYICHPDIGIVSKINDRDICKMADVIEAFETNEENYHRILTEADYEIILDRRLAKERNELIMRRYGIPVDRSSHLE